MNRGTPLSRFEKLAKNYKGKAANASGAKLDVLTDVALHETGLNLTPGLDLEVWADIGARLARLSEGVQWALGDWWAYGYFAYGKRKAIAKAQGIPYEFGTLMNFGSIALKIPTSRRNEALTFSHHCVVASLRADEQTEWLDKAANRKLSVRALRESIKDRRDRDVGENPELEAEYWAERLYEVAQKSQRFGWDQPERLKLLRAETLDRLIKITNETAQYWDQAARGLEQYRRPGRERIRATNQVAETAAD